MEKSNLPSSSSRIERRTVTVTRADLDTTRRVVRFVHIAIGSLASSTMTWQAYNILLMNAVKRFYSPAHRPI